MIMKKIFKVLSSLTLAVLLVSACKVDHPMPTYSPVNDCEVSFVQSNVVNREIDGGATSFEVVIARNTTKAAATVNLKTSFTDGVVCPSSVSFNAGEATAVVTLDISTMKVGNVYKGTIPIADESAYNPNIAVATTTLTLAKVYTWVSLGMGEWFDNLALMTSSGYGIRSVEVLKAEGFNRYRIMNPYNDSAIAAAGWEPGGARNSFVEFWVLDNGVNVAWDGWWCPGILYSGAGTDIKAYYPSYLTGSTAEDGKSKFYEEKVIGFYPYWYIDGLGGFGTKYPCFLSLPGGPALESWL